MIIIRTIHGITYAGDTEYDYDRMDLAHKQMETQRFVWVTMPDGSRTYIKTADILDVTFKEGPYKEEENDQR